MHQQRDIFADRDWFLIGLVMVAMTRLGITLIMVAHYLQVARPSEAWLEGVYGLMALFLVVSLTRYNRWAYLVWLTGFAVMAVLGLLQIATEGLTSGLYRYAGVLNVIYGAVFVAGLLARWRDFMSLSREGPRLPITGAEGDVAPQPTAGDSGGNGEADDRD